MLVSLIDEVVWNVKSDGGGSFDFCDETNVLGAVLFAEGSCDVGRSLSGVFIAKLFCGFPRFRSVPPMFTSFFAHLMTDMLLRPRPTGPSTDFSDHCGPPFDEVRIPILCTSSLENFLAPGAALRPLLTGRSVYGDER